MPETNNRSEKYERLKDAVCKAAKAWANNDKGFTRIALRQAAFNLWEFEQEQRERIGDKRNTLEGFDAWWEGRKNHP